MDEEGIIYLIFSLVIIVLSFAILTSLHGTYTIIGLVLVVIALVFIIAMNWADFLLMPALTSVLGMTFQPARNYTITKGQNAIIKNVNGLFYATGYITANLFAYTFKEETAAEEDEVRLAAAPEMWERAVMSLGFPYKFHVLSCGMDVQKVRDEIEGRRSFQEFQLSRALQSGSNEVTVTDLQRRVNIEQAKMDRISQGEKPIATLMYAETTAVGITEKAATDALDAQIKQLQIALSSLDLQLNRIVGRELYTLFRYNFSMPNSFADIASAFDQQM